MDITKKYQIFISSTYKDLIVPRNRVLETILSMYHFPIGMEMFSAGNDDQWTVIKRTIDISDYYVLIVGHRYGSVTEEGISYTEKEYDYARKKGIPILAFIKDRNAATIPSERESDTDLQLKLNTFVNKAMGSKMCDFWRTEDELASKVSIALMKEFSNNPRIGWVRADQQPTNVIKKNIVLDEIIEKYLYEKEQLGLEKSTISQYKQELKIFSSHFINISVYDITSDEIRSFLKHREDNYKITSKGSLEKIRGIIKGFFDWLVEEKILDWNPVKKVKPFRQPDVLIEALNEKETWELREACITLRERALIEFMFSTGCQLNEIEKLNLKNINWNEGTISITGLNHRNRLVLLTSLAAEHLKKYINSRSDNTEFLFITDRKPYRVLSRRGVQREITCIAKRTNINKKISPKTFRHTFAKIMLKKGYTMDIVQSLLGNKHYTSTSETYNRITNENIKELLRIPIS